MNTAKTGFLIIEIKSIAIGYRVLQLVSKDNDVRVLEASPAGDRFILLITGAPETLELRAREAKESLDANDKRIWIDQELITDCAPEIVEAFYHLPQVEAGEALIIVETETVSGLLASADSLVRGYGLKVIEIKIKRTGGGAYGFFTGSSKDCAPGAAEIRTRLKRLMREGRAELIEKLSPTFRSQFNLSGSEA